MSSKNLDHHADRVYIDGLDNTINIEVSEDSDAYALVVNTEEEGDGVALVSINLDSKLGQAAMRGFGGDDKGKRGTPPKDMDGVTCRRGYDRLWHWFSMSYASWLTIPRVMMHEMPDEWQYKMGALMEEWDDTWDSSELPSPSVSAKKDGKYTRWPEWVLNYRRPNTAMIRRVMTKTISC
jgi:hypothetical protein